MNTEERIRKQLQDHAIILYMKGIPDNPECGFSAKAVAALQATGIPFTYVNVLGSPFIREKLPKISKWPTFPQLFINGELIGGSDIIESMAENSTLLPALQRAEKPQTEQSDHLSHNQIQQMIWKVYPDATIEIKGEGCDLTITVVTEQFNGLSMLKQQQGVLSALEEPLRSGQLHAVGVKPFTPEQWHNKESSNNDLIQIK